MKVLIAMSGGIDSSVVAHLLKEQGHEIVGVRFTLWSDPLAPALAQLLPSKCCDTQSAVRCAAVAKEIGIPLHIVNLEKEFKEIVVERFLDDYRSGLTPNPCIGCNRQIKFGKLMELASEYGCDKLATGHYARVAQEKMPDGTERFLLLEATDVEKDQSYYIHDLSQTQLRRVLFPLGAMHKRDVFALAKRYGIPFDEHYRESQDLCFFPEKSPHAFIKRHLKNTLQPGTIVRRDGTVVGKHEGLPLYTLGQRRGLKIGGLKIPLEVVAKDVAGNRLIVAEKDAEKTTSVRVRDLSWVSWQPPEGDDTPFDCRTRSLSPRHAGRFRLEGTAGTFTFDTPVPPQSPGQSLVLYRGDEVIGGGIIV
ncbi:MAG: tRNA 2-thiouridine(34) synthase MnmA [Candidatus Peribacteraceae bacterium]|nr:tRNA 2-thiouridine(34) synthase MnmA [Candidatus Peribacteraceae bacterium]